MDTIVAGEMSAVAPHHMDIEYAVDGRKPEDVVLARILERFSFSATDRSRGTHLVHRRKVQNAAGEIEDDPTAL